jgi:uncharacterized protein HemY
LPAAEGRPWKYSGRVKRWNSQVARPHYAALGTHFHEGEVWGKALRYLRQAGAQASARSAYREAGARFRAAVATLHGGSA